MKTDLAFLWVSVGFVSCGAVYSAYAARYDTALFLAIIAVINSALAVRRGKQND